MEMERKPIKLFHFEFIKIGINKCKLTLFQMLNDLTVISQAISCGIFLLNHLPF